MQNQAVKVYNKLRNRAGRTGFTLIEVLVVVLIIGILAAVALPQYQKVVEKAKTARMLPVLHAINSAQNAYYLEHGHYALQLQYLDIQIPDATPSGFSCHIATSTSARCDSSSPNGAHLEKYYASSKYRCWGNRSNIAKAVCESICGRSIAIAGSNTATFCEW